MKVALCFIISYEHVLQKERYWYEWINANKDLFNIYFHYKDKNKIKSPWILNYCIPETYISKTSYYYVVQAYMSLLLYSYNHDKNNKWFCMLTDSCIPIISPEKFRKIFFDCYNKSIIRCNKAHWNVELHQRANLKYFSKEYHLVNDPWFTLCRYHVHLCILFMAGNNGMYEKINNGGLANESLFAIILKIFNEFDKNKLINSSGTICDWYRMASPTSPHLFNQCTEEDKNIIMKLLKDNPYALFLRKVNYKFPDEELIKISSWSWDLTLMNNQNINNQNINNQNINNQNMNNQNNKIINKNNKYKKKIFLLYYFLFFFFTICFTKMFMNT